MPLNPLTLIQRVNAFCAIEHTPIASRLDVLDEHTVFSVRLSGNPVEIDKTLLFTGLKPGLYYLQYSDYRAYFRIVSAHFSRVVIVDANVFDVDCLLKLPSTTWHKFYGKYPISLPRHVLRATRNEILCLDKAVNPEIISKLTPLAIVKTSSLAELVHSDEPVLHPFIKVHNAIEANSGIRYVLKAPVNAVLPCGFLTNPLFSVDTDAFHSITFTNKAEHNQFLQLTQHMDIELQLDASFSLASVPDDELFGTQWSLSSYGADVVASWKEFHYSIEKNFYDCTTDDAKTLSSEPNANNGKGIGPPIVVIIDTGVDPSHHDLVGNVIIPWDFKNKAPLRTNFMRSSRYESEDPYDGDDDNGHGTHCAGIVAALTDNGVGVASPASKCKIISLKVFHKGASGSMSGILEAMFHALILKKVHGYNICVVNMSLSGPHYTFIDKMCEKLWDNGITVVAAAGNDPSDFYSILHEDDVPSPGGAEYCITVGALEKAELGKPRKSKFSSVEDRYNPKDANERRFIWAPGTAIMSTYLEQSYKKISGTSMASPLVASAVALCYYIQQKDGEAPLFQKGDGTYVSRRPIDPSDIYNLLHDTGEDFSEFDAEANVVVYKRLNVANAVKYVLEKGIGKPKD
jgi:major intracellular serine protease